MSRPNILLIMSDEHDPAVSGCYGHPVVQTPNLDRLASQGVLFEERLLQQPHLRSLANVLSYRAVRLRCQRL